MLAEVCLRLGVNLLDVDRTDHLDSKVRDKRTPSTHRVRGSPGRLRGKREGGLAVRTVRIFGNCYHCPSIPSRREAAHHLAHAEILAGKPRTFTAIVRDLTGAVYRGAMTLEIERQGCDVM